jgi:hypothetical protein
MLFHQRLFHFLLALFLINIGYAQVSNQYYLPQGITYNTKIPTPQAFLGYQVGEWHASHDQVVAYMRKLAETSDRIKIEEYGRTHENRPLILLTITSPQNHTNINDIKKTHRQLSDPDVSASLSVEKMPIVVWMGYTVHGNEASGVNASLLSAYYLAAAQGTGIDSLLNNMVVLLDPCINPDGMTHKSLNLVTDPNSREFNEVWPNGRSNHYWFDLNRDYLYQQHPESKSRMAKYHEWKPNILTDHHEMGTNSSFFFQPGVPSRVHPLTPQKNIELTNKIGQYHATALDNIKSLYYTQENFDDFYYGKGSSYPDANGCIGILFEQGSSRGHAQESINGIVNFSFTIRNQFTATLSTLKAAQAMRTELLSYQRDFYRQPSIDLIKSYVFGNTLDKVRLAEMVNIFRRNDIKVYQLTKDEVVNGRTFGKNDSYVIPMSQPQHRLIKSMFERRTTFADSLFYDISSWTMPLCFNMPFAESQSPIALGEQVLQTNLPEGKVIGKSQYAYIFEWDSYLAPRAAYTLLQKGYKLKVATEPFVGVLADGSERRFDYGTIAIPLGINMQQGTDELLVFLAKHDGVDIYALKTGLTPSGIDIGSNNFMAVRTPKPLMVVGQGIDANDAGEVWHLMDDRLSIPLTMCDISMVNRINLDRYNTLILVSGNYSQLSEEKIKTWVQNGGTIVAMTDAVKWASEKGLTAIKWKTTPADTIKRPFALQERFRGAQLIAGAIFQVRLDPTHPLCYGYKDNTLTVFRDKNFFAERNKDPYNTPLSYTERPLISGYLSSQNERMIKNTPAAIISPLGSGRVISLLDNPNFRAFWYGTNKLFMNALFFANQMTGGSRGGGDDE